ncbi:MAG: histidine kinase [Cyclobacteriaceae bacterium]
MSVYNENISWKGQLTQIFLIFFIGGLLQEGVIDHFLMGKEGFDIRTALLSGGFWVVMWKGSEYMVILMDKTHVKWDEKPLVRLLLTLVLTVVYIFIAVTLLNIIFFVIFGDYKLLEIIKSLNWSSYSFSLYATLAIGTIMHGRGFLMEWRQAAIEMERFKNESLKSKYESLKNQVNPHFLFNSLNALSSLVYDDQAKAVEFIRKLSQVYRYVLENKDHELVPLDDELEFLRNYIFLQKIRFGENLIVEIDRGKFAGFVPPLGIQLLVENAIKHNIVSENKPLKIDIIINDETYSISNNIQEKLTKDSTGIGLKNLISRYEFLTKKPVKILNENGIFDVRLPALKDTHKIEA